MGIARGPGMGILARRRRIPRRPPAKAQAIVEYRKANGAFKSAEELAMVKGIGLKTVEKNRDRIEVGRSAAPAKQATSAAAAKAKPVARR